NEAPRLPGRKVRPSRPGAAGSNASGPIQSIRISGPNPACGGAAPWLIGWLVQQPVGMSTEVPSRIEWLTAVRTGWPAAGDQALGAANEGLGLLRRQPHAHQVGAFVVIVGDFQVLAAGVFRLRL